MNKQTSISLRQSEMMAVWKQVAKHVLPLGSQVWLYGSRARKEAREDSDWDLLILIDKDQLVSNDEDLYSYPFVVEGWKHASAASPLLFTYKDWQKRSASPFYSNVEHDKIRIL